MWGESWATASGRQGGGVAALAADVVVDDAKPSCLKKKGEVKNDE